MSNREFLKVDGKEYLLVPIDAWTKERLRTELTILKKKFKLKGITRGQLVSAIVRYYVSQVDDLDSLLVDVDPWKLLAG